MNENNSFYLQGTSAEKESFNKPEQIEFEWNIIYSCNYRCSYCFFEGKWEEYGKRNVILSIQEWVDIWKRIYEIYGRSSILITGGEPFVYPDFVNILRGISEYHYPINISSNGTFDFEKISEHFDNTKISITLSLHPEFNTVESVLEKKKKLKSAGFDSEFINFVAFPPLLDKMDTYVEKIDAAGEKLKVIPFIGTFDSKSYPGAYSIQQRKLLGLDNEWKKNINRKGMICAAGKKSALIFPDGKVVRCGQIGERFIIGNIFDKEFKLLDEPLECDVESCPCLESPEK